MHNIFHHHSENHHHHHSNNIAQTFHTSHIKPIHHFQPVKPIPLFQPVKPINKIVQQMKPINHFKPVVEHHPAPPQDSNSQPEQPKEMKETLKPDIQSTFSNFFESDTSYILYGIAGLGLIIYILKK
jgi:hypothetical protein